VAFFKIAGNITDNYPSYITLPLSFLLRASAALVFIQIKDPRSYFTYVTLSLFILGTLFENTTLDGLFNKNLPKDIRGTLNGAYNFFGNIGILFYSKYGGMLYDRVSPSAPFVLLAICDVAFALLIIGLRLCKKFND
jgi:predicted MFS family arabinose efflux permease